VGGLTTTCALIIQSFVFSFPSRLVVKKHPRSLTTRYRRLIPEVSPSSFPSRLWVE
jgi:hypothetical protein